MKRSTADNQDERKNSIKGDDEKRQKEIERRKYEQGSTLVAYA